MEKIEIDFETYSEVDLRVVGAHRYASDPSTDVLCMAYSINDEEPDIWIPGMKPPEIVFDCISDGFLVYAWNAAFEICIWEMVTGWPEVPFLQWRDTQAIALTFALPAELKKCGEVLNAPIQKDPGGTRLINQLSKPQKPTNKHPYIRYTPKTHPKQFDRLYEYCKQDVLAEQSIHTLLPWELTEHELEFWRACFYKNRTGIPVDMDLVNGVTYKLDRYLEEAESMLPYITKQQVWTIGQRDAILDFIYSKGYSLPNLQSATVEHALNDPVLDLFPAVKQILTLRSLAGKASVKKFYKIKQAVCSDNRVRDCFKYHRATTGREGGRLLQPQNMPRAEVGDGSIEAVEAAIESFIRDSFEDTLATYEKLFDTASALVRPTITAPPGRHFKVADYNAVEARGVCWLAEQDDVLDLFRRGQCVYTHMATKIYNIPAETITKDSRERFHGKQTILGCGYGMAWKKFQVTCAGYGLFITDDEAKKTITIFRKANAKIVHLWKMLQIKAVEAISKPNTYTSYKKISFMFTEGYLFMVLPNGKLLAYPKADVKREENPWGKMVWNIYHEGFDTYTKQWTTLLLTGTRLTENGTQAICREILLEACLDLIRAGYNPMLTVHDEAVSEDDDGFGSLEEMCAILCARSEYWEGFPLKAEGFTAIRYRK